MATNIQAANTNIAFDKIDNISNKKVYSSIGKPIFTDGDLTLTGKTLDINALIDINTTSNNLEDNLPFPSLLLNWSGAKLLINGKTYTINTTPELLEAIIAAAQTTTENENLPIQASTALNELNALKSRIYECEEKLGLSHG